MQYAPTQLVVKCYPADVRYLTHVNLDLAAFFPTQFSLFSLSPITAGSGQTLVCLW